jgi:hypothetical protein
MAAFSVDNARHMFVGIDDPTVTNAIKLVNSHIVDADPVGTLSLITNNVTTPANSSEFYFEYKTPNGDLGLPTVVRTPLIKKDKVTYVKASKPAARITQQVYLTPVEGDGFPFSDSTTDVIHHNKPQPGQDYIVRFVFYGLTVGGQEVQYIKEGGAYRARANDTWYTVFQNLEKLCAINLKREEPSAYITVKHVYDNAAPLTGHNTLVFTAVEQPWVLGKKQANPVQFSVETVPVYSQDDAQDIVWGYTFDNTVNANATSTSAVAWTSAADTLIATFNPGTPDTTRAIGNGKIIADQEWFYLGERAAQDREWSYPNNFNLKYVADPSRDYYSLDLTFYFSGPKEDQARSQAALLLAIPVHTLGASPTANALIQAIITLLSGIGITAETNL